MRTCLGILLMVPALIGLAITGIYHVSVNSQLRFEKVDTQDAYINKQRSYRAPQPGTEPGATTERTGDAALPSAAPAPASASAPAHHSAS